MDPDKFFRIVTHNHQTSPQSFPCLAGEEEGIDKEQDHKICF